MKKVDVIIDGENAVVGRLASFVAKQALLGNEVAVVNAEKAIVVGNKADIIATYLRMKALGGGNMNGPFVNTLPERLLKRSIRGMIAYKEGRGRAAFKRIKCYKGIPREFEALKIIKSARGQKGITLDEISREIRGAK